MPQDKKTALHWAVEKGHKDVASLLVERGADIEAKDRVFKYLSQETVLLINYIYDCEIQSLNESSSE
jgi:ankyrin repeat protein